MYLDASGYRYPDASGYRQNHVPRRVGVQWIVVPQRVGVPWIVVPRCVMIDLDQSEQHETILLLWLVQVKVWRVGVPRFTVPRRVGEPCFAGTLTGRGTMNQGTPTRRGTTIHGTATRRGTSFFLIIGTFHWLWSHFRLSARHEMTVSHNVDTMPIIPRRKGNKSWTSCLSNLKFIWNDFSLKLFAQHLIINTRLWSSCSVASFNQSLAVNREEGRIYRTPMHLV